MPIELQVEAIDKVDESIRGAYVEAEGKFTLDPDKYHDIKAQGLLRKNSELIGREKTLKAELAKFDKFKSVADDDWNDFQDWLTHKDDPPPAGGKPDQQALEKAIAKEKARYERDLKAARDEASGKDGKVADLETRIREFEIWTPVRDLAVKAGVMPDRLNAVMTLLRAEKRFDLNDDNKLVFQTADGLPTTLTPERAFQTDLKQELAWAFPSSGAGGSGAPSSSSGAGGGVVRITREQAKDPSLYRAAKDKAAKDNLQFELID